MRTSENNPRDWLFLAEQFWAQHYPGGDLTGIGANYPTLREQAGRLVAVVRETLKPSV